MKEKEELMEKWIANQKGTISTRDAWLAGFECAKNECSKYLKYLTRDEEVYSGYFNTVGEIEEWSTNEHGRG